MKGDVELLHFVTVYYQHTDNEIQFKAIEKKDVPNFVKKHNTLSHILVVDPRNRIDESYKYGEIIV